MTPADLAWDLAWDLARDLGPLVVGYLVLVAAVAWWVGRGPRRR